MILHKTGQTWGNYPCEKVISSLLKTGTTEFTGSPLSMKTQVCASMLVSVVHEYQSIIKCHGDERWSLLASQEVAWEPLTLLQPLHLQVHICQGCKLHWPTDVLWCVLAGNSLWGFTQLRTDMQLCGCCLQLNVPPHKGSRVCWDVCHLTSPAHQYNIQHLPLWMQGCPLPHLEIPARLKLFFTEKWWKMTPQRLRHQSSFSKKCYKQKNW